MDKETKRLDEITEGFLHPTEPPMLYELGKKGIGKGVIVEIGSWKGRSTILITRGAVFGNKLRTKQPQVFAIDTFKHTEKGVDLNMDTFKDFKFHIKRAKVSKYITPLIGRSTEVVKKFNKPIEFIFIDGSHDYKSIIEDIENWCPKIIKGGWVAFHDSDHKGVMKAFKEKILNSREYSNIGFCGTILYAQKVPGVMLRKKLIMLHRKILVSFWKDLPEPIKVLIRTLLRKQHNSAPIRKVPKGSLIYEKVKRSRKKRARKKKKSYWTPS